MVELEGLNKRYHRKKLTTTQPTNPADGFQPPLIRMLERRTMRRTLIICVLLLLSQTAASAERCPKPDPTLSGFLAQFAGNAKFQRSRIIFPLVYRYGSYWISDPKIELWDLKKVESLKEPLFLSEGKRKERSIVQTIPVKTPNYVEVYHHKEEADTYQLLFKFRKVEGCWYLEEIHDTSF